MAVDGYGGWWCCCQEGCWYFYDDFCHKWHPDGEVRPYWIPEPDDFGYWFLIQENCPVLGVLVEIGTPGAILRTSVCVPAGPDNDERIQCNSCINAPPYCSRWMRATYSVMPYWQEYGDTYSLLLDYKDPSNYLEYSVTLPDDENGLMTLRLGSVVNGVVEELASCEAPFYGLNEYIQLEACVRNGVMYGNEGTSYTVTAEIPEISCEDDPTCGLHAAIKQDNDHPAFFTDWTLDQVYDDNKEECFGCGVCDCLDSLDDPSFPMPAVLKLTFVIPEGTADCFGLDGLTIDLLTEACSPQTWIGWKLSGDDNLGSVPGTGMDWTYSARLLCADGIGDPTYGPVGRQLVLGWENPLSSPTEYASECNRALYYYGQAVVSGTFYSLESSRCDPLYWVFESSGEVILPKSWVENQCPQYMQCCEYKDDGELGPRYVCPFYCMMVVTED